MIFKKKIGKDRILVLPYFPEDRSSRARLNTELGDFNYQNISTDLLTIPVHEIDGAKSYFAIMDGDGKLEMIFFPQKEHSAITQAYFKEVEKRLQKNGDN